jgi:eukaryotic-like serine/threonine-protein kinase
VLHSGTVLGRYEIRSHLGSGGMGEVYLARDLRLDRNVALKILPGEVAADPDRMRRFEREARAASSLNHPNIITIHEIDGRDNPPSRGITCIRDIPAMRFSIPSARLPNSFSSSPR